MIVSGGLQHISGLRLKLRPSLSFTNKDSHSLFLSDAYDKTAKLLQIPWIPDRGPGPAVEVYARPDPLSEPLYQQLRPLPTPTRGQLSFSFAGLKSATEKEAKRLQGDSKLPIKEGVQRAVARRFQNAAVGHICEKIGLALDKLEAEGTLGEGKISALVVSGGVASNAYLRTR